MKIEKDYQEFLRLLNKHRVKYCIIGSYAVAFYGYPRYTKDIDILIEKELANAKNLIKALREFGFSSLDLKAEDFLEPGTIIQLGYEPIRIDIITSIKAVNFDRIWANRKRGKYGKSQVNFIGLEDLKRLKRRFGRHIDKADLEFLEKIDKYRDKGKLKKHFPPKSMTI